MVYAERRECQPEELSPTNLFPCLVTAPDQQTFQTCRVFAGPEGTQVWWWDRELGDARMVLSSPYSPEQVSVGSRHYRLATDDGEVHIAKSHSCGCGNPMKRWQLPKPVREGTG